MSFDMPKCKITVVKRLLNQDLAEELLNAEEPLVACTQFSNGQEVVVDADLSMPEGFCPWAWADIRHEVMTVAVGGDPPWIKQRGTMIAGCTDWFRPVIFKIERLDQE